MTYLTKKKPRKPCCCGRCQVRMGCATGVGLPTSTVEDCCSCVPQFVCISLLDDYGLVLESQEAILTCDGYTTAFDILEQTFVTEPFCTEIDIALVVDDTGSMGGVIASLKAEIGDLITAVDAASNSFQFSLITFKDSTTQDVSFSLNNTAAINAAVAAMTTGGGNQIPEASDIALNEAVLQSGWRSTAQKIIVLITDAPPGGLDDVANLADVTNLNAGGTAAGAADQYMYCIGVGTNASMISAMTSTAAAAVAAGGGGKYETLTPGNIVTNVIALVDALCPPGVTIKELDVNIRWNKDDYAMTCDMCLLSNALGYTWDSGAKGVNDNRLCVPMAPYGDRETKKCQCEDPYFEWEVESYEFPEVKTITMQTANYTETKPACKTDECFWYRICLTVNDGTNEWFEYACFDEYKQEWRVDIDGDPNKYIRVLLVGTNPTVLQLFSYLNYETLEDPINPACPRMEYTWGTLGAYGDASIKINGDIRAECSDCHCVCDCLCVAYYYSPGSGDITTGGTESSEIVCRNAYGVWELAHGDWSGTLELDCVGCETRSTVLRLGAVERDIICPNGVTADFNYVFADNSTLGINVKCAGCGPCEVETFTTPCCPEKALPRRLYATITDETNCAHLDGVVVELVADVGGVCWSGETIVPDVSGVGDCGISMALTCFGVGDGSHVFKLGQDCNTGSHTSTSHSCDPLMITFTGVDIVGCCDVPVSASITVVVTA